MKLCSPCGDGRPRPSSRAKPGNALAAIRQPLALFRAALREILATCHPAICHPEGSESSAKRSTRGVEGPLPSLHSLWKGLTVACKLSLAVLREIFDESAYERFLAQYQLTSSAAAYSSFSQERDRARARRPRCC